MKCPHCEAWKTAQRIAEAHNRPIENFCWALGAGLGGLCVIIAIITLWQ